MIYDISYENEAFVGQSLMVSLKQLDGDSDVPYNTVLLLEVSTINV